MWHLYRMGLWSEAKAYNNWLHQYRGQVLFSSEAYAQAKEQIIREGVEKYTYLKVVRDPIKRCISSYRHAIAKEHAYQEMSETLDREISPKTGFSFATFLEFLSLIDLRSANIHHRFQCHPLDGYPWARFIFININEVDLTESLSALDREAGLPVTFEIDEVARERSQDGRRYAHAKRPQESSLNPDVWKMTLDKSMLDEWPHESEFCSPEPLAIIRRLYGSDIKAIQSMSTQSIGVP